MRYIQTKLERVRRNKIILIFAQVWVRRKIEKFSLAQFSHLKEANQMFTNSRNVRTGRRSTASNVGESERARRLWTISQFVKTFLRCCVATITLTNFHYDDIVDVIRSSVVIIFVDLLFHIFFSSTDPHSSSSGSLDSSKLKKWEKITTRFSA